MRFTPALCAAALSWPLTGRATAVIVSGGEDVATDPYAVAIEGPASPTEMTLDAVIDFGWGLVVEPGPGTVLPVLIPMVVSLSVAGQEFDRTFLWDATANFYAGVNVEFLFNVSFVGSGELDFELTGGFCNLDMCPVGQGDWWTEVNNDAGAGINGTLSYDPVPEPSSLAVLGIGAVALLRRHRLHVHH